MKYVKITTGILLCMLTLMACQSQQTTELQEPTSGGMITTGELSGSEFAIATGDEMDNFMEMVEAFNLMDASGIWAFSADTITLQGADGITAEVTVSDFEGLFSTIDSLSWDIKSVVPLQVTGTNIVRIIADTREVMYMNDGSVTRIELLEEFTFEGGILTGVRQWTAELPREGM